MEIEPQARQTYTFLIERSPTPIYQRITRGFKDALETLGHKVLYFDPTQYQSDEEARKILFNSFETNEIDYCFLFSNSVILKSYIREIKQFVFEVIPSNLIFVYHDRSGCSFLVGQGGFKAYYQAVENVKDRSWHFCLECNDVIDLRLMGFERVYPIFHASEFGSDYAKDEKDYEYNISFVGHVLPSFAEIYKSTKEILKAPFFHRVAAEFWNRLVKHDRKTENYARDLASQIVGSTSSLKFFEKKFYYVYVLGILTPFFRGELIQRINDEFEVDIVGGDPGYISGLAQNRNIEKNGVKYHPPTKDYAESQYIYENSKINLNITSLQFDEAVVNRVIDVGAAGGFILTDWKNDLKQVTSVHEEISYRTIEELNYKIDYYLTHETERQEIAEQLHQDVMSNYRYENVVRDMISKLNQMPSSESEVIRIDLGCGPRKAEGFVGVDIYDWEGVDVVADLTRQFPFQNNSIDEIRAYDVIEHLSDCIHTMNEIWRIGKPEALVDIWVPSTDGRGAFQDPTHVSFWNINSFKYYCNEFPAYLDLCRSYGFKGEYSLINLSQQESGDGGVHVRAILKVIKPESRKEGSVEDFVKNLKLRKVNLAIFIDWTQPEEAIREFLGDVLRSIATHPDREDMNLLVDVSNFPQECEISPEEIISEIALTLMLEENLDILNEGAEIFMLPRGSQMQWQAISSHVCGRIQWEHENANTLASLEMENMQLYDLTSFSSTVFK
jgi:spore maturation protein CgeB